MSAFFFDAFRLIKHAFRLCFRPATPQHTGNSHSYYYLCKMRILIAMTLLMFILTIVAAPLKQAKIKRGSLNGRNNNYGRWYKPPMTYSRHSPSKTPGKYHTHPTPTKSHPTSSKHSSPTKRPPTPTKHYPQTTSYCSDI